MPSHPPPHRLRTRLLLAATAIFILLGILYGLWWFFFAAHHETTDDAYVHGNLVQVTSQISGTITAINADDTDIVRRGASLVRLDSSDAGIELALAQAQLAQTVRQTRALFAQNQALEADVEVHQANVENASIALSRAESDLKRRQGLARSGGVSGEELHHAEAAVHAAQAAVSQTRAALAAARAKLETNKALTEGTRIANHPDVQQAAAHVRQAWLTRQRTQLPAPVEGMVAQRSVQVGQHVAPGTPLMTIVPLNQVWVEANFKEVQVAGMKPGQHVALTSDTYGSDVVYDGIIEGVSAGTGSAFALLPAQNASGNWIKVVQRLPVRIALNPDQLAEHPLRIGMSMSVDVDLSAPAEAPLRNPAPSTLATSVFEEDQKGVDAMIARIIRENNAP